MLKMNDLNEMDQSTIHSKIEELRGEIFTQKIEKGTSGLQKSHILKGLKKDLARCLTVLSARADKKSL